MTLTNDIPFVVKRLTDEDQHQTQPYLLCHRMLFPMSYMFRPKSTIMFRIQKGGGGGSTNVNVTRGIERKCSLKHLSHEAYHT
jgi:hypothetical protein